MKSYHFVTNRQNPKKSPLRVKWGEGTHAWRRLRLQRETQNQVSFLRAGVGNHLPENGNLK